MDIACDKTPRDAHAPLKRTRAKRSCDFCRQRKSRCDADTSTPCSNCRAWGYTCEFQTVRKKRGPPSVYVDNLEKRCKKMEQLLMQLTNTSIKDLEVNDFKPDLRPRHRRTLSDPSSMGDDDDSSSDNDSEDDYDSYRSNANNDDDAHDDVSSYSLTNAFDRLDLKEYDTMRYAGMSAGVRDIHQDIFKSQSRIHWPGRNDTMLQLMPNQQVMVVRTETSSSGKCDTFLGVGLSISSNITSAQHPRASSASCSSSSPSHNGKPPKKTLDKMIDMYFAHLHSFLPIINKVRFLQYYRSSPHVLPKILYESIFAVTLRHFSSQNAQYETWSEHYFRKVMKRLQDSVRPKLCQVQAALLMTIYMEMDGDDVESVQWYTLGKAIRMAQDLGLHRSCEYWQLPRSEMETRHRIFYACYILDRWISARAGKPLTILDRDFDTKMPSVYEVDDDGDDDEQQQLLHAAAQHATGPAMTNNGAHSAPTPTHGNAKPVYRAFVHWIKLSEILGRTLKALYAPSAKIANSNANLDDPTILMVLDKRLTLWKAALDEPMNGTMLSVAENVTLHFYYYTLILLLRRPFKQLSIAQFPQLQPLILESRQACSDASQQLTTVVKHQMTHDHLFLLPTCFIYGMFLSCLTRLSIVLLDKAAEPARAAFQLSMDQIRAHGQLASAQRAIEILNMLAALHEVDDLSTTPAMTTDTTMTNTTSSLSSSSSATPGSSDSAPVLDPMIAIKSEDPFAAPHTAGYASSSSTGLLSTSTAPVYDYPATATPDVPMFHHVPPHQASQQHPLMASSGARMPSVPTPVLTHSHVQSLHHVTPMDTTYALTKSPWNQRMMNSSVVGGGYILSQPEPSTHAPGTASANANASFMDHGFTPSNIIPSALHHQHHHPHHHQHQHHTPPHQHQSYSPMLSAATTSTTTNAASSSSPTIHQAKTVPSMASPGMPAATPAPSHTIPSISMPPPSANMSIDPYATMMAPTDASGPANLNWQDWQYFVNHHHDNKS